MSKESSTPNPFYLLREMFQDALGLAPGLTDKRRLLALVLVRRSDESIFAKCGELVAWIGADKLAKAMQCDRRTVQRGLSRLLADGIVEVEQKGGGRARSTRYRFSKRWLGAAAVEMENCGIAEAYGLPDDLFAFANGGSLAAVSGQYRGAGAAVSSNGGIAGARNSGSSVAVLTGNSGIAEGNSRNSGTSAAVSVENCGAFSDAVGKTAALEAGNCGISDGNCGTAVPPEIDLNNRNKGRRSVKTAAPPAIDRDQGHFRLVFKGGRPDSGESSGFSGPVRVERWQSRLAQRAAELIGDRDRAALAVEWLEDGQKQRIRDGLRPTDAELHKWLGWALGRAEAAGQTAAHRAPPGGHSGGLPVDVVQAVQQAAQRAVLEALPSILPTLLQALQQHLQGQGGAETAAA